MYRCKSWTINKTECQENWYFWTVVLEKTFESPFDYKEIKPVHPKGNQSWIFTGRTDAEDETPILWPPDAKSQLIGKDPNARKDWRQEVKGTTEDEMVGWHHQLNGHESEQDPGDSEGQRSLVFFSSWSCKELDTTEWLNTNLNLYLFFIWQPFCPCSSLGLQEPGKGILIQQTLREQ